MDKVQIDPNTFRNSLKPAVEGEHIFDEGDLLRFLVDTLNKAGIDIAKIQHDYEHAVEYGGQRDYFSVGVSSLDTPEDAVIGGMTELSNMLNNQAGIESWTSYKDGKHFLHLKEADDEHIGDSEE